MSDFLVNLARRSAGLAPVVRARTAPVVAADPDSSADGSSERQVASRGGAGSAEAIAREPSSAPRSDGVTITAPAISPAPVARMTSHVAAPAVQRAPAASSASAAPSTPPVARGGDVPVVAPRAAPQPAEPSAIIVPAAALVANAPSTTRDDAPRARDGHDEPRTIETRTHTVVRTEPADPADPVVVTIEPVERASTAAPALHAEPAPERTVHVRIGAIEIHGADAASQQHALAATPAAAAPSTTPVSTAGGFDEYAALRSYAPWAW